MVALIPESEYDVYGHPRVFASDSTTLRVGMKVYEEVGKQIIPDELFEIIQKSHQKASVEMQLQSGLDSIYDSKDPIVKSVMDGVKVKYSHKIIANLKKVAKFLSESEDPKVQKFQ